MKHFILIFFLFISCVKDESRDADKFYESKNFIEAIELYNEIINLKPNDIKSIYRRGRSYEELKQFELQEKWKEHTPQSGNPGAPRPRQRHNSPNKTPRKWKSGCTPPAPAP